MDEGWSDEQDTQLEEAYAYATYLDARRQFANLKAARGFYPVVALAGSDMPTSSSSSTATTQRPIMKGGKGKKGKGKGKTPPQKGSALARGRTALDTMQCFKCGRFGHAAAECPMNKGSQSPKRAKTDSTTNKVTGQAYRVQEHQAYMMHDLRDHGLPPLSDKVGMALKNGVRSQRRNWGQALQGRDLRQSCVG